MKKTIVLLFFLMFSLTGCSLANDQTETAYDKQTYTSANGYSIDLPADWLIGEETIDSIEFMDEGNQIALSITSELGGVDYFAMSEIKKQLSKEIADQILIDDYEIINEDSSPKYFRQVLSGIDIDNVRVVVDIFALQPYYTMRHYIVIVAAQKEYQANSYKIEDMISSIKITFNEEEYLQLMDARRSAKAAEIAEEDAEQTENVQEEADTQTTDEEAL